MLRATAISKVYRDPAGEVTALAEVSHEFAAGKITAIVGPSGSGKSTLLNLLAGFDDPTTGQVFLDDQEIGHLDERERAELRLRKIGFVFQSYNLISVLNAQQNVAFPMGLAGVSAHERQQRAEALLRRFGLGDRLHHLPYKLSGGERQRVSLARALANDPAVVFADEPTGNLDSKSGKTVVAALQDVAADGRCVIIVTHDLRLADAADVTLGLEDGHLVSEPPHAIGGPA
ncbi:MAG: ABC transporter ATP-binding protein [Trueperaceae bacterium]|nr:ABC transporter ATP-binding protein [Trueperaceae bacterium]